MIEWIRGVLRRRASDCILVESGDLGYKICISSSLFSKLPPVGESVELDTYWILGEGAEENRLYGFQDLSEKELFVSLLSVRGVGPRAALKILSETHYQAFIRAVREKDLDFLKRIKGVGPKMAQQILLDLKSKIENLSFSTESVDGLASSHIRQSALEALKVLQYREKEAGKILDSILQSDSVETPETVEELVQMALKKIRI